MLSTRISAQQPVELQKYSYLLIGIKIINGKEMFYPLGTCFFIRESGKLLLITAKHCITGYDVFSGKKEKLPFDRLGVRYYIDGDTVPKYRNFGPYTTFDGLLQDDYFYKAPDLLVLNFNAQDIESHFKSIESYIIDGVSEKKYLSYHSYGFGLAEPANISHSTQSIYYEGRAADRLHIDPYYPINDLIYYVIQPKTIKGMSGSPVFSSFVHPVKGKQFFFNGVIFGNNKNYDATYVIEPSIVREQILPYK